SLSGPSPSANLVGIWKGDPLGPACAGHPRSPRQKRVARRTAISCRGAQPYRRQVMTTATVVGMVLVCALFLLLLAPVVSGAVLIRERQVGLVVKKFGTRTLPPRWLIALQGEAGYQADTLAPGLHFGYWPWQYRIIKVPVTIVPQGEIALVLAADGAPIPTG